MNAARPLPELPHYRFVEQIAALPFVQAIVLYGSRARGDAGERSDIDLAVAAPAARLEDWQQVVDLIDEADTLLSIDCVRLDTLPKDDRLRANIEAEGIELYRRSGTA